MDNPLVPVKRNELQGKQDREYVTDKKHKLPLYFYPVIMEMVPLKNELGKILTII